MFISSTKQKTPTPTIAPAKEAKVLILTRKQGESITIGDDIKVTVLGVFGRQVRLGVESPIKVVVHREEVFLKIKNQSKSTESGDEVGDLGVAVATTLGRFVGRVSRRRKKRSQQ